jgi:hypothetical protein
MGVKFVLHTIYGDSNQFVKFFVSHVEFLPLVALNL